jgi:hypothetical protein
MNKTWMNGLVDYWMNGRAAKQRAAGISPAGLIATDTSFDQQNTGNTLISAFIHSSKNPSIHLSAFSP